MGFASYNRIIYIYAIYTFLIIYLNIPFKYQNLFIMKISKSINSLANFKTLTKEESNYIKGGTNGDKKKKKKKTTTSSGGQDNDLDMILD